ncbi:hypothetical protein [Sphingomonas sp. CROZ-RG-20F-R02-07]|uniref:hypothetical protein n=1 Tax=Sphingomonas sp. CROZ-RG-20F-R02-07 TaxID=2914832 RepID=UPI001F597465|nr:hypothetical protein [Sphingomonas sp. CROZ-RG-20F-R02-07]
METSFDLLLWRETLTDAAAVPTGYDFAQWAQCLDDAGKPAAAALLANVAVLHQGFSPQAIASRERSSAANNPLGACPGSNGDWTLHRAMAELRALAGLATKANLPSFAEPPAPVPSGRPDNPAGIGEGIPAPATIGDLADTARQLRELMESPSVDAEPLATLLAGLVEANRRCPALDYRVFAAAPLDLLVPVIATIGLIDFALSTRDLWSAPLGSPELFHFTAQLDSTGLGPYLNNIGRVVRDSRDMGDLARIARHAAGTDQGDLTPWIVLLSRRCPRELLYEIVDDLGDVGAETALSAILNRVTSRPAAAIDQSIVMRLRDAGLDNAHFGLAARAQQVIVQLSPESALEGLILGEIEASGGAFARAEAIFRYWLDRLPDDRELAERLVAAKTNQFDRFALTSGFGSPANRRDTRLRRRGVPARYPRRIGDRIRAVDVG